MCAWMPDVPLLFGWQPCPRCPAQSLSLFTVNGSVDFETWKGRNAGLVADTFQTKRKMVKNLELGMKTFWFDLKKKSILCLSHIYVRVPISFR